MTSDDVKVAVKAAVREEMPEAIGEALAPLIYAAVRADTRSYRRKVVVGFLVLFLGVGYGVHDNRERSTRARGVLCTMLVGSDMSSYAFEREGTLTRRQLERSLRQSAAYRRLLRPAPSCSPTVTPPPVPVAPSLRPRTR